jgi:threonine dehydratase
MTYSAAELGIGGPVCAILSGGNVDSLLLTRLIGHGLGAAGRYLVLRVTIPDRAGSLGRLLAEIGRTGASVFEITHSRTGAWLAVDEAEVSLTLETRGPTHRDEVIEALVTSGYTVRVQD